MRILWICSVWPEPNSSAAGARTALLLAACRSAGHEVCAISGCKDNRYRQALEAQGIRTACFAPNDARVEPFLAEYQPTVVIFDKFMVEEQFGFRVHQICPDALRVLDTVDLHLLRRARQRIALTPGSELTVSLDVTDRDLDHPDTLRELSSVFRSDLVIIVSQPEADFLAARFGVARERLVICGMLYRAAPVIKPFESRKYFLAIGNLHHVPNADSFTLLAQVVWPAIRKQLLLQGATEAALHLYGAYPDRKFFALADPDNGLLVKGRAADARETLARYRVNLAPLRFGAGVKGKIADGWAEGTPCVTTSIGAEGMINDASFGGVVTDDWNAFAACAVELYTNKQSWERAQEQGTLSLLALFDHDRNVRRFFGALNRHVRAASYSRDHWLSKILWQQQFRSTEYFSRWIEEKQQRQTQALELSPVK